MSKNKKLAIIASEFNFEIVKKLIQGVEFEAVSKDVNLKIFYVPGAVEIPFASQQIIKKYNKEFDAIITLGVVIKGDTDHYNYVCNQASYGIQKVMLNFDFPIIFGILTVDNVSQAIQRADINKMNKGKDFLNAALRMINFKEKYERSA